MNDSYSVIRPPLAKTYELPSRDDLLDLKPEGLVKVTFQVGKDDPERLWVLLKECTDIDRWIGITDNDPLQEVTAKVLPAGSEVVFHPLDIIATE